MKEAFTVFFIFALTLFSHGAQAGPTLLDDRDAKTRDGLTIECGDRIQKYLDELVQEIYKYQDEYTQNLCDRRLKQTAVRCALIEKDLLRAQVNYKNGIEEVTANNCKNL